MRRRKLDQEVKDILSREADNKLDYQKEKGEIGAELDRIEINHMQDIKHVKDNIIDTEVETRKAKADFEKQQGVIDKLEQEHG